MYSQSGEEEYILNYFKGRPVGRLLDIGAYHPTVFSNSRALIELGWSGVLVEPSPKCFGELERVYKDSDTVDIVNIAIGTYDGKLRFHDSGGANATAVEEHYKKWKPIQLDYEDIEVDCVTWETFYRNFPGLYNFINIDTEGMDYDILKQMDLNLLGTELLCIEYSYNTNQIVGYLQQNGFGGLLFQNGENIMVGKR